MVGPGARAGAYLTQDALIALTLERSTIAYMPEHKDRVDDAMARARSETVCNFPSGSDSAKVRQGGFGLNRKELTGDIAARIDAAWTEIVTPSTGFAHFMALEAATEAP